MKIFQTDREKMMFLAGLTLANFVTIVIFISVGGRVQIP